MKINIPEKIKKTLYVTVYTTGYSAGDICVNDYDSSEFESSKTNGTVLICTTDIEIELPPNFDVTEPLIALLEKRRESIVQEFSLKLKAVDQELAEVRALPAPEQKKCAGFECSSTDGTGHSAICELEHELTVYGIYAQMGDAYPGERYAGYSGEPLNKNWSLAQQKAYLEGCYAREPKDARAMARGEI